MKYCAHTSRIELYKFLIYSSLSATESSAAILPTAVFIDQRCGNFEVTA